MPIFRNCDLRKADFRATKIKNLQFDNCQLEGASFENATLQANLCDISSLKDVSFKNTVLLEASLINAAGKLVDLSQADNLEGAMLPKDYLDKLETQKPTAYTNLINKKIALPTSKIYQEQVTKYEISKKKNEYSLSTNYPPADKLFEKHFDSDSNNEKATDATRKQQFMDMLAIALDPKMSEEMVEIASRKNSAP